MAQMQPQKLHVLLEDNHLLCVVKPAGISSQSDQGNDFLAQCREYVRTRYNKPGKAFLGLVHRLDRDVSGVMVFARTSKAASRLSEQFRAHTVEKVYAALVEGVIDDAPDWVVWEDRLTKDEEARVAVADAAGQSARLRIKATGRTMLPDSKPATIVEVQLDTGRYHQIRFQCATRGHPIVGDEKYGSTHSRRGQGIALFAVRLAFNHPVTQARVVLEVAGDPFEADRRRS